MGLFDFMKDIGANILGKGNPEAKIKELLDKDLEGKILDLSVEFEDGTVTLAGECDTQATKEKAVLLAGNVKGVGKVNDENLMVPVAEEPAEFYTIVPGDSLSKIAKRYYGDAMKYPVIFEANREVIKNPDLIYPGQQIRIPKLDK
jgi:nucleoid-associated protein YgaU